MSYSEGTWYSRNRESYLARQKEYRQAHPDKRAEIERGWRVRNPAKCKARGDSYYARNKEHVLARCAANYAANRERYRELRRLHYLNNKAAYVAKDAKRRAAEIMATPGWLSAEQMEAIRAIYTDARAQGLEVDHIVPLRGKTVCGLHVPWNLQILSREENRRKWNHLAETS